MKRREFLKTGALAGGATLVAGCGAPSPTTPAPVAVEGPDWQEPAFEHAEATVADLASAQAEGRLTARALTEAYLARIEAVDRSGPRLNSVIESNPDALAIAAALDAERAAARHPRVDQGQHRQRRSHAHLRRLSGAAAVDRPARCVRGRTAARGGRSDPRQDQPE